MSYDIIFDCPGCGKEIQVTAKLCGEQVECIFCNSLIDVPIPGLNDGLEIGDFVLEQKLGAGGMGEVWLARQGSMNRMVALKVLNPQLVEDEAFVRRFLTEAEMAGKLEHPNIITAYSAGNIGDYYYLATSFVDGIELLDKLKIDGVFKEREALKIIRGIALALNYAWNEHRLLHRDIKPGNIMVDKKGVPRLMDMGISKIMANQTLQTKVGLVVGTPDYISPEQARALPDIDFRSDVYSLGATLYHLVTGSAPYQAENSKDLIKMHVKEPLPDPHKKNPLLSEQCVQLINIMMAKDRNDRQSSWTYVLDDIDAVLAGRHPVMSKGDRKKTETKASGFDDQIKLSKDKKKPLFKIPKGHDTSVTLRMNTSGEIEQPTTDVTLRMDASGEIIPLPPPTGRQPVVSDAAEDNRKTAEPAAVPAPPVAAAPPKPSGPPPKRFVAGKKRLRWLAITVYVLICAGIGVAAYYIFLA